MILTKKQGEGLDCAVSRYKAGEKYTVISGYAGSGKTTLIKFIIDALGQVGITPDEDVVFATPTGKAAVVLSNKGNKNVTTIHKLLYEWFPRPDGTYGKRKRISLDYKIIVVDECSMIPKSMVMELLRFPVYVIFTGDPGQLPPVDKTEENGLLAKPHVFLDEIMRQSLDSEIIRLTLAIRNQEMILPNEYGKDVLIVPSSAFSTGMMEWADQILVATNANRISVNNQMRELLGRESNKPENGDKVISLHNEWDTYDSAENPLINGTIGYLDGVIQRKERIPSFWGGGYIDVTNANLKTEIDSNFVNLNMDTKMILTGEKCVDYKLAWKINKNGDKYNVFMPLEFAYGYAITTHKAQGSEWNKVVVLEEKFPFAKDEHARWLYTSATRASSRLVLIRS